MWCEGQDLCRLERVETQMWYEGQDLCSLEGVGDRETETVEGRETQRGKGRD